MKPLSKLFFMTAIAALALICSPAKGQSEQPSLTGKQTKALIADAQTPEDHKRIAAYYRQEAKTLEEKHVEHEEDLAAYNKNSSKYPSKYPTMGNHCRELAASYASAAKQAQSLADMHASMALTKK